MAFGGFAGGTHQCPSDLGVPCAPKRRDSACVRESGNVAFPIWVGCAGGRRGRGGPRNPSIPVNYRYCTVQRYRGEPGHTRDTRAVQYANVSSQGLQHQWPTGAGDPLWETRRGLPPDGRRAGLPGTVPYSPRTHTRHASPFALRRAVEVRAFIHFVAQHDEELLTLGDCEHLQLDEYDPRR